MFKDLTPYFDSEIVHPPQTSTSRDRIQHNLITESVDFITVFMVTFSYPLAVIHAAIGGDSHLQQAGSAPAVGYTRHTRQMVPNAAREAIAPSGMTTDPSLRPPLRRMT